MTGVTGDTTGTSWLDSTQHHQWLQREEERLVGFYAVSALHSKVGFSPMDANGVPDAGADRELWLTCRMVHCFAIEHLRGRPGAASIATHGVRSLADFFEDAEHGGWYAAVAPDGTPTVTDKGAYGHAFVILAGAGAKIAGIEGGEELLERALRIVDEKFWDAADEAVVDAFSPDWRLLEPDYRGQNANMHLVEAYMAAHEATSDARWLERARAISERIINREGRALQWRVPEHFGGTWTVDPDYNRGNHTDPFRPFGSLVGHWFEWARLVLQLDALTPGGVPWALESARALLNAGLRDGWDDTSGGSLYSVDFTGQPVDRTRMYWVPAEGIGACVALARVTGEAQYEVWYRRFWEDVAVHHLDLVDGGWVHEVDAEGAVKRDTWPGKPDLYHALQATLYARLPFGPGLVAASL